MVDYIKAVYGLYAPAVEVGDDEEALEGQGMVEYALILALVSIIAIAALELMSGAITDVFDQVTDALPGEGDG